MTLYFEVELSSERRPGTEQNTSVGALPVRDEVIISCLPFSILGRIPAIKPMVISTCAHNEVIKTGLVLFGTDLINEPSCVVVHFPFTFC